METLFEVKELEQQLKKTEVEKEKLLELNAKKDRLFSTIAHDLRSPFQTLLGMSEILSTEAESLSVDEIIHFSSILNEAIKNQFKLLNNILDWARLQTGKIEFNPQKVDLKKIIEKTFGILNAAASKKQIRLIAEINNNELISADEDMLLIILQNLISNAIKFSYKDSVVKVTADNHKDKYEISVKDNGVGLSKETIEKIFRFDSKYTTPGTEDETGSGLGLMISSEMTELHKGKLSVRSEVERGSVFTLTIPII
jgi:two-component system, sensor histidine kinase and response regulator